MAKDNLVLGIIGGSGIYDIDGVENGKWVKATTPYGDPSDEIFMGSLNGINVAFLPRHGRVIFIHQAPCRIKRMSMQ